MAPDSTSDKRRGATIALWIGVALVQLATVAIVVPQLQRLELNPGFVLFFAWAAFCIAAVLRRSLLMWVSVALVPLCLVALVIRSDWRFIAGQPDNFGFYPWGALTLFTGMCLVVAMTGIISVILATWDSSRG
jgi:hypothetical protein